MPYSKSPNPAGSNSAIQQTADNHWKAARQATIELLRPQFTGIHWLQLSLQAEPLLNPRKPEPNSLWVDRIEVDNNTPTHSSDTRLTSFSKHSADGIFCDQLIQSHPQPERVIKEIQQLLRPGGWVLISGAGSLRGKQAASVANTCIRPEQIVELLENDNLKLARCYTHANHAPQTQWQKRIEQWRIYSRNQVGSQLPSLLPVMCRLANTRPGWIMLFKDETLGMTPLPSPLKSRRINMQTNSAISLCDSHVKRTQSAEPTKPSKFTTRAA